MCRCGECFGCTAGQTRVFTPHDWIEMAQAATGLDLIYRCYGQLINPLVRISTLDDPYYMDLAPDTYRATLERRT